MLPVFIILMVAWSFHATNAARDATDTDSATSLPSNVAVIIKLLGLSEAELQAENQIIQQIVADLKATNKFVMRKNVISGANQTALEEWWTGLERQEKQAEDRATRERRGAKPKCVAAFDFDKNLIRSQCTSEKVAVDGRIRERVWSDSNDEPNSFTRLEKIKEMFGRLTAVGCKVVVITRNLREYVQKALKFSDPEAPLEVMEVVGQKEFDNEDQNAEKGSWLRKKLLEPWGFEAPFNEVIFSDDDPVNTEEVSTSLEGATVLQPTDGLCTGAGDKPFIGQCGACEQTSRCPHGLSIADMDRIIQWAINLA